MNTRALDTQTETQVVAMLSRGDTYQQIVDWLVENKDIKLSVQTIGVIKKRNSEALEYMKQQLVEHQTTMAAQLLEKSRRLIDRQLNKAGSLDKDLDELQGRLDREEIGEKEYYNILNVLMRNMVSVRELNAISKESFNQAQLEAGKPTSIAENPAQAKANLATLLNAINSRDDAAALKAIFPDD